VSFITFAGGITFGLLTLFTLFNNGIMLGVIGTACHQYGMSVALWSFVAAHGSLELPSILIAGAAGLRLGHAMLFPATCAGKSPSPKAASKPPASSPASFPCWSSPAALKASSPPRKPPSG
jgi:uncharacterized membrane protein SpoIIM required for sporulation